MKFRPNIFSLLFLSFFLSQPLQAAPTPADLVKVTTGSNTKCVEYYSYKGEMYCSTKAYSAQPIDPAIKRFEKQKIVFDQRAWQAVWGKKNETGSTVEYVPMGDDIDNWHELVTSQFFPGLQDKATPKQFSDAVLSGIKEAGYEPIVTFIKESPNVVIFEFRIKAPSNQIQDEIQKVTKGPDGIYAMHYAIKVADMGEANRKLWLSNLTHSKP